ncbi:MAG: zinc ABC transporter substrate-binding protein [Oscillospiraceae bacterium]|jgi:zinc transport system substrate-binding protein|nr:zinc ABC transporter substrate-binding protein [Oscillospiraceae bacterium]
MKKCISLLLALCVLLSMGSLATAESVEKLNVVTTIFPPYDFTRAIAGDLVNLDMLLSPGSESHSFEPTPQDMLTIQNADLFIYTGGENDTWVDRILGAMDTSGMRILRMTDMVATVNEEIVEGMEHEHEHEEEEHHEEEEAEFDPATIQDRPITDFDGDWKTTLPYLLDGTLDEYVQQSAETNEVTFDVRKAEMEHSLRSEYPSFNLKNGVATINGVSALYEYAGFSPTSSSAWYILKLADGTASMPGYLLFNDHGIGVETEHAHDHGADSVAHTHFKYGENVDDILAVENWSTFYVDAAATAEQVLLTRLGVSKADRVSAGYFEASEVQDRPLSDWYGDWQSVSPLVGSEALAEVWEHKAEAEGETRTAEEIEADYQNTYATPYDRIVIKGDSITYTSADATQTVAYEPKGFMILPRDDGTNGIRFNWQAVGDAQGAPQYVQFSDHNIAPTDGVAHFHLYMGNEGFEALADGGNAPTYYAYGLSPEEIAHELIGHGGEEAHDHEHEEEHAHEHEEETELDEHVWTSPKNAMTITRAIADALSGADPVNAVTYQANAAAYIAELSALDAAFQSVVDTAARKTILFGDRFPFRYFADAYGLTYSAAFTGCSTETEASAATIKFLIDKVRAENLPVVFTIELSTGRIADAICEETGAKKGLLHSAHNLTRDDFAAGVTYLDVMRQNIEALKEALN